MNSYVLAKEGRKEINELAKKITEINKLMKLLNVPQDILEKEIKPFGNASHIILPKEYKSKTAKVIIKR
jgi:putative transposon-encoded protein